MPRLILFFVLITISRLAVIAQDKPSTKREIEIVNLIAHLPEVVNANKYMMAHGPDHRHLQTYIDGYPTKSDNNYLVRVCEFNGMLCAVHFFFYVDAQTLAIKYFDVVHNKSIPLALWRKQHYNVN